MTDTLADTCAKIDDQACRQNRQTDTVARIDKVQKGEGGNNIWT